VRALSLLAFALISAGAAGDAAATRPSMDEGYVITELGVLPSNPVIYVHLPIDRVGELPAVTRDDGAVVPVAIQPAGLPEPGWWRLELEIERGMVYVTYAPTGDVRTFAIEPALRPTTRSATLRELTSALDSGERELVELDSDAVVFVVDCADGERLVRTEHTFPLCRPASVRAFYPDRTDASIVDTRTVSGTRAGLLALCGACLVLLGLVSLQRRDAA
jgi:hypothetical protein